MNHQRCTDGENYLRNILKEMAETGGFKVEKLNIVLEKQLALNFCTEALHQHQYNS
jgi:hypothetical protein